MPKEKIVFCILISVLLTFGCADSIHHNALVIHDCTGTYLRYEDRDDKVSNPELLESVESNTIIDVKVIYLKDYSIDFACLLWHDFDRWVEIEEVL